MGVNSLKTLRVLLWEDKPSVVANRASITLGRGRYFAGASGPVGIVLRFPSLSPSPPP